MAPAAGAAPPLAAPATPTNNNGGVAVAQPGSDTDPKTFRTWEDPARSDGYEPHSRSKVRRGLE